MRCSPLAALITTDCFLTVFKYPGFSLRFADYAFTWGWYLAAMVLGSILLRKRVTVVHGAAGALLGPTSFPRLQLRRVGQRFECISAHARRACNLLLGRRAVLSQRPVSTSLVLAVMLGVPALVRRTHAAHAQEALAGK